MKLVKIIKNLGNGFEFDNGWKLYSDHEQSCCEHHELDTSGIEISEYEDLEFNLQLEEPFKRIHGYGIELIANNNFPLRIPGYGYNNGYYSDNLNLILIDENHKIIKNWDITDCQSIDG